jgi:hypothetical protein
LMVSVGSQSQVDQSLAHSESSSCCPSQRGWLAKN